MTRDDIIRMAEENGIVIIGEAMFRFAALVASAERNRIADESKHIIKRAEKRGAEIEREACAKVCEDFDFEFQDDSAGTLKGAAEAIRARGEE
jgi:DNA invertase Pin-like site-specific DNA recombinase